MLYEKFERLFNLSLKLVVDISEYAFADWFGCFFLFFGYAFLVFGYAFFVFGYAFLGGCICALAFFCLLVICFGLDGFGCSLLMCFRLSFEQGFGIERECSRICYFATFYTIVNIAHVSFEAFYFVKCCGCIKKRFFVFGLLCHAKQLFGTFLVLRIACVDFSLTFSFFFSLTFSLFFSL